MDREARIDCLIHMHEQQIIKLKKEKELLELEQH